MAVRVFQLNLSSPPPYILINAIVFTYGHILASYPGRVGGEKWPGNDCLCMRDHSQKNLGVRLHLGIEIVGKINTHMSGIFPYH